MANDWIPIHLRNLHSGMKIDTFNYTCAMVRKVSVDHLAYHMRATLITGGIVTVNCRCLQLVTRYARRANTIHAAAQYSSKAAPANVLWSAGNSSHAITIPTSPAPWWKNNIRMWKDIIVVKESANLSNQVHLNGVEFTNEYEQHASFMYTFRIYGCACFLNYWPSDHQCHHANGDPLHQALSPAIVVFKGCI